MHSTVRLLVKQDSFSDCIRRIKCMFFLTFTFKIIMYTRHQMCQWLYYRCVNFRVGRKTLYMY